MAGAIEQKMLKTTDLDFWNFSWM